MENYQTIVLIYILFIWFVVLHTLEEISQEIFGIEIGPIKVTKKKYLFGATLITTVIYVPYPSWLLEVSTDSILVFSPHQSSVFCRPLFTP